MRTLVFAACLAFVPSIGFACTYEAASSERDAADIAQQRVLRRDADVVFLGRVTGLELLDDERGRLRVTIRPIQPHFRVEGDNPPDQIAMVRYQCHRTAPGQLEERAVVYAEHAPDGTWSVLGAVSLSKVLDPAIRELALAADTRQRDWESE